MPSDSTILSCDINLIATPSTGSRTAKLVLGIRGQSYPEQLLPAQPETACALPHHGCSWTGITTAVIQLMDVTWREQRNVVVSWESLSETLFSHPFEELLSSALFLMLQFAFLFLIVIRFLNFANKMCSPFWFLSSSAWQIIRLLILSLHFTPPST